MQLPVYFQLSVLLYSVVFGLCSGVLYDIFCALRVFFPKNRIAICVLDVVYFLICAVAMALFVYFINSGELRAYILLTAVASALVFHLTAGRPVLCALRRLTERIRLAMKSREKGRAERRHDL